MLTRKLLFSTLRNSFAFASKRPAPIEWTIVRGDYVKVMKGNDEGKMGEVLKVIRKKNKVVVQGVNAEIVKRRAEEGVKRYETVLKENPIPAEDVSLIDPQSGEATPHYLGYLESGERVRIAEISGAVIPKPAREDQRRINRKKDIKPGPKDTPSQVVLQETYGGEDLELVREEFEGYIKRKEEIEKLLVFSE